MAVYIKYCVMSDRGEGDVRELDRFDTEQEASEYASEHTRRYGQVKFAPELWIKKVWTKNK